MRLAKIRERLAIHNQRAFTLLELLIALCVSAVALSAAMSVLTRSAREVRLQKADTVIAAPTCKPHPAAPVFFCALNNGHHDIQIAIMAE